ncbi:MAG: hypothetical protein IPG56_04985 [Caulobacteraceae bacterium]|nr:hypothetical protein [Caulobacteraceae bacterium]
MPNFFPAACATACQWLPRQAINLGLDLQGGSQLLLEIDRTALQRQQLDNVADQMATALRDAEPAIRFTGRGVVGDARMRLVQRGTYGTRARRAAPAWDFDHDGTEITTFTEGEDGLIEARMTDASLARAEPPGGATINRSHPPPHRPDRHE